MHFTITVSTIMTHISHALTAVHHAPGKAAIIALMGTVDVLVAIVMYAREEIVQAIKTAPIRDQEMQTSLKTLAQEVIVIPGPEMHLTSL